MYPSPNYTVFPISLIEETIAILKKNGAEFALPGEQGERAVKARSPTDYRREYGAWQAGAGDGLAYQAWWYRRRAGRAIRRLLGKPRDGHAPPGVPAVFLQHDADRNPQNTIAVMERELACGAVSASYFFRRRAARWPGDEEPYDVDIPRLQELERAGFEVGYHLNGPELANYDAVRSQQIIEEDVAFFREKFMLRSFVPHGGRRGPNGENNDRIQHDGCLADLVWFYNTRGLMSDVMWSDGHLEAAESRSLEDPRLVAQRVKGRMRAHFLFHPQYYGPVLRDNLENVGVVGSAWWRGLWPAR